MKLILPLSSAASIIADRHNLLQSQVEITHEGGQRIIESPSYMPAPDSPAYAARIKSELQILANAILESRGAGSIAMNHKIPAIKALRTLVNCGLRDAKDAIEALRV